MKPLHSSAHCGVNTRHSERVYLKAVRKKGETPLKLRGPPFSIPSNRLSGEADCCLYDPAHPLLVVVLGAGAGFSRASPGSFHTRVSCLTPRSSRTQGIILSTANSKSQTHNFLSQPPSIDSAQSTPRPPLRLAIVAFLSRAPIPLFSCFSCRAKAVAMAEDANPAASRINSVPRNTPSADAAPNASTSPHTERDEQADVKPENALAGGYSMLRLPSHVNSFPLFYL